MPRKPRLTVSLLSILAACGQNSSRQDARCVPLDLFEEVIHCAFAFRFGRRRWGRWGWLLNVCLT